MSREKTAEFLADCLGHMPPQRGEVKAVVDTVIADINRIANGQEWPADEARAAAHWADWVTAKAARATAREADWVAAWAAALAADWVALEFDALLVIEVAHFAAVSHPDPAKERERQKAKRKELKL